MPSYSWRVGYLLAGRWIVVLVCYLDDSGKDPQNPITTLAGYAATEEQWRGFETEVEPIFADCGVKILHTKDLHKTDGEFEDWRVLQKQAFVARICRALSLSYCPGMSGGLPPKRLHKTGGRERSEKNDHAICMVFQPDCRMGSY